MTTYSSYEAAKIANPESEIVTKDERFATKKSMSTYNLMVTSTEDQWVICNPADHCMTVEKFLADGHTFVEGDIYLDNSNCVRIVGEFDVAVSSANANGAFDNLLYILRAAALEEKEESELIVISDNDLIEKLFDGFNRITAESEYQDAYDIACEMLELESERANLKKDKPKRSKGKPIECEIGTEVCKPKRTKTEFVKCEFDQVYLAAKAVFDGEELFVGFVDHSGEPTGEYSVAVDQQRASRNYQHLYRKVEVEIDERQEFIDECKKYGEKVGGLTRRENRLVEKLFAAGCRFDMKGKLMEGK